MPYPASGAVFNSLIFSEKMKAQLFKWFHPFKITNI